MTEHFPPDGTIEYEFLRGHTSLILQAIQDWDGGDFVTLERYVPVGDQSVQVLHIRNKTRDISVSYLV